MIQCYDQWSYIEIYYNIVKIIYLYISSNIRNRNIFIIYRVSQKKRGNKETRP